jgi:hypothetical protein
MSRRSRGCGDRSSQIFYESAIDGDKELKSGRLGAGTIAAWILPGPKVVSNAIPRRRMTSTARRDRLSGRTKGPGFHLSHGPSYYKHAVWPRSSFPAISFSTGATGSRTEASFRRGSFTDLQVDKPQDERLRHQKPSSMAEYSKRTFFSEDASHLQAVQNISREPSLSQPLKERRDRTLFPSVEDRLFIVLKPPFQSLDLTHLEPPIQSTNVIKT